MNKRGLIAKQRVTYESVGSNYSAEEELDGKCFLSCSTFLFIFDFHALQTPCFMRAVVVFLTAVLSFALPRWSMNNFLCNLLFLSNLSHHRSRVLLPGFLVSLKVTRGFIVRSSHIRVSQQDSRGAEIFASLCSRTMMFWEVRLLFAALAKKTKGLFKCLQDLYERLCVTFTLLLHLYYIVLWLLLSVGWKVEISR